MKLPDVYSDWRIVLGLALVLLGAGNWVIGLNRTERYSRIIAHAIAANPDEAYRSFDELDSLTGSAVLEPFNHEQRRVSYATARMDYYHATFIVGQVLTIAGLLLVLLGFTVVIQSDARRALRRIRRQFPGVERERGP